MARARNLKSSSLILNSELIAQSLIKRSFFYLCFSIEYDLEFSGSWKIFKEVSFNFLFRLGPKLRVSSDGIEEIIHRLKHNGIS